MVITSFIQQFIRSMRQRKNHHTSQILEYLNKLQSEIDSLNEADLFKNQKKYIKHLKWLSQMEMTHAISMKLQTISTKLKRKLQLIPNQQLAFPYYHLYLNSRNQKRKKKKQIKIKKPLMKVQEVCDERIASNIYKDWEKQIEPLRGQPDFVNKTMKSLIRTDEEDGDEDNLFPPLACLGCIQILYKNWSFPYDEATQNIVFLSSSLLQQNQVQEAICTIASKGSGYVFGDIASDNTQDVFHKKKTVVGSVHQKRRIKEDTKLIKTTVSKIRPEISSEEYWVDFIPVEKDPYVQYGEDVMEQYVLRITIDIKKQEGRLYYVEEKRKGFHSLYKFTNDKNQTVRGQKIYEEILSRFAKVRLQRNIKKRTNHSCTECVNQGQSLQRIEKDSDSQDNQREEIQASFGTMPKMRFKKTALILIKKKAVECLKDVEKQLVLERVNFEMYQIYDKIDSFSKRWVYFITYDAFPFSRLNEIIKRNDPDKKSANVFELKHCLYLREEKDFDRSVQHLIVAKNHFKENVSYFQQWIRTETMGQLATTYFFGFGSLMQTIFAFVLLEQNNIRTNFASKAKSQGAKIIYL